jgi:type II secretory pathway pseudopilin PulG
MFVNNNHSEAGDTIVEVLISIAVVSVVLAGAFVVTNRSLQATRSSQERSIALKLAESQLEQIKGLSVSNPGIIFNASTLSPFCIVANVPVPASNAGCATDASGAPNSTEPVFRMTIIRTGNLFSLTENWQDVNGRNADKIQLKYRVYQ